MKKSYIFLLLAIIIILCIIWFVGYSNMKNSNTANNSLPQNETTQNISNNANNSIAKRIAVPLNSSNTNNSNNMTSSTNITNQVNPSNSSTEKQTNTVAENSTNTDTDTENNTNIDFNDNNSETELSSFSTKILTSDPNRNNNIQLTCSTLNEHIVEPGETFSFTGLIGKSTTDKGYKKANVIAADGDTIKGLGGGNCQVSSTLYNAVTAIPELEVVERHNHGSEVYYVPLGQDAAVAYGSVDFKFKNNLDTKIKIYASSDDKNVTVQIVKLAS